MQQSQQGLRLALSLLAMTLCLTTLTGCNAQRSGATMTVLAGSELKDIEPLLGDIERIVDEPSVALPIQYAQLKTVLQKVLEIESASNGQTSTVPADPAHTVYRLFERLPFSLPQKLDILATASVDRQIELCSSALMELMQKHAG